MRKAISILFSGSPVRYDYWADFPVKVGDSVMVDTRRGAVEVVVVEVKDHSDKATASARQILGPMP